MQINQLYQQLKEIALDDNLTVGQAESLTKQQVANLLGLDVDASFWSGPNIGFWVNLKANAVKYLKQKKFEADKQFIINALNIPAFNSRFPDVDFESDETEKVLKIWFYGRPE